MSRRVHDSGVQRSRTGRPHGLGRPPLLPRRPVEGRDRRRVRPEPLQGRPPPRRRPRQRAGAHRDPARGRDRRRHVSAAAGPVRPAARGRPRHPRRRRRLAARPPRAGGGPAARRGHHPAGRARPARGPRAGVPAIPGADAASLRDRLGRAAAQLLAEVITPQDVLGLAWARAVSAMARALPPLPGTPVVQLTGAMSLPGGPDTSVDVVREVASASGGAAHVFYAPFTVPNAATARALRQPPAVARAFAQLPAVTKAVAGIGLWAPGLSVLYDALPDDDRAAPQDPGARADAPGGLPSGAGRRAGARALGPLRRRARRRPRRPAGPRGLRRRVGGVPVGRR